MSERNGWLKLNTKNAENPMFKMIDVNGNVSVDAFFNRVSQWIKNGKTITYNTGVFIEDGVYRLVNKSNNKGISTNGIANKSALITTENMGIESYYSIYHLGINQYRIIRTAAGLSLDSSDNTAVKIAVDANISQQKWEEIKVSDGVYRFKNIKSGKFLTVNDNEVIIKSVLKCMKMKHYTKCNFLRKVEF